MTTHDSRIRFFDCPLDLVAPEQLLARTTAAAAGAGRLRIEGLNVAKLIDARSMPALRQALEDAELVHIDGFGLKLGLAWLNIDAPQRRAGHQPMAGHRGYRDAGRAGLCGLGDTVTPRKPNACLTGAARDAIPGA